MKKLSLILALAGGISLSASAHTFPGTRCGMSEVKGVLVICCKGPGDCVSVTTKPPKVYDVETFVITTYANGDITQVDGQYEAFEVSATEPDADGSTTITARLVP